MSNYNNISLWHDMAFYALSKAVPGLVSFVFIMFLIRNLGDEGYGAYALIVSVITASTAFGSGWVKQAVIRYRSAFSEGEKAYKSIIRKAILGSLLLFSGIFLVVENIVLRTASIEFSSIVIAYFIGAFSVVYAIKQGELQAAFSPKGVLSMEVTRTVTLALISIALITIFGSHYELALIAFAFSFVAGWFVVQKKSGESLNDKQFFSDTSSSRKEDCLRGWWSYGWPLSLWLGCIMLMQVTDKMVIQHYFGIGAAGQYSSIFDLVVRGYGLFVYPVTLAIHPRIMKSANTSSNTESKNMILFGITLQVLVFIPVLFLSGYFNDVFLNLTIGDSSEALTRLVVPLVCSAFLWQLAIIVHKSMEIAGYTRAMLGFAVLALIINGALNWVLVPKYGAIGGAYSTIAAALVYIVFTWFIGLLVWSKKKDNLRPAI